MFGEASRPDELETAPAARPWAACTVCGDPLNDLTELGHCKACNTPPRGRTLSIVLERVVRPALEARSLTDKPVLAFAVTGNERKLLSRVFPTIKSASLYGGYDVSNETGVDVRDLSRYASDSFSGMFGILLFDYFPEHEQALREVFRVLAPGGVMFTLISHHRVVAGAEPPVVTQTIVPRPGYFDYIPEGGVLYNVNVGQDWLLGAMAAVGFEAQHCRILDSASGEVTQWFIGVKPSGDAASNQNAAPPTAAKSEPAAPAVVAPAPAPERSRTYSTSVDPAFGFKRVVVHLSVPGAIPADASGFDFAEHAYDARSRKQTREVVALAGAEALVSGDNGDSWRRIALEGADGLAFHNCFTTSSGDHLLYQAHSKKRRDRDLALFRYGPDWTLKGQTTVGRSNWHGPRSIDEARGVIMFAGYPDNLDKYSLVDPETDDLSELSLIDPAVYRSKDGGATWSKVFSLSWKAIRHFHTMIADPFRPGVWWLSSGDRAIESFIWMSPDDGDTWIDATNPDHDVELYPMSPAQRQSIYRHTDMAVEETELLWAADDWLGGLVGIANVAVPVSQRAGARVFRAPAAAPMAPRSIGYVGNPVRNIVDVGPAYLAITEAKTLQLSRPQVLLLSKQGDLVTEIFTVDVHASGGTGFTYSRCSRKAHEDGSFFSFKGANDVFPSSGRILKWQVEFH